MSKDLDRKHLKLRIVSVIIVKDMQRPAREVCTNILEFTKSNTVFVIPGYGSLKRFLKMGIKHKKTKKTDIPTVDILDKIL